MIKLVINKKFSFLKVYEEELSSKISDYLHLNLSDSFELIEKKYHDTYIIETSVLLEILQDKEFISLIIVYM